MPKKIVDLGGGRYRLYVSLGYDTKGSQIYRTKTISAKNVSSAQKEWSAYKASLGKIKTKTMTLHDFYNYYTEHHQKKNLALGTIERNEFLFRKIDSILGHKPIDKIEPENLLTFLELLRSGGEKQNSIVKHYDLLHTIFSKAIQWRLINDNPCDHIDKPKKQKVIKPIFEIDMCKQFLTIVDAKADFEWKCCVYLALYTGLRKGELFGLQFKHLDIKNNSLLIEQEVLKSSNGSYLKHSTKTYKDRIVSFPVIVTKMILKRKKQVETRIKLLGDSWKGSKDIEENFIFCSDDGRMNYGIRFNRWLTKFLSDNHFPHITPHSFRHMTATYLISAGVDLQTVSGKLGHNAMTTTARQYSHLLLKSEQGTSQIMQSLMQ